MSAEEQVKNILMLMKQSKKNLSLISSDGKILKSNKFLICMFSDFFRDIFLDNNIDDDDHTFVTVPLKGEEIEVILDILDIDGEKNETDKECDTLKQAYSVLGINTFANFKEKKYEDVADNKVLNSVEEKSEGKDVVEMKTKIKSETDAKILTGKRKHKKKVYYVPKKKLSDPAYIYDCDKCEAVFKRCNSLKKHQLVAHDKKIECDTCENSFINFKTYQKHLMTHINYTCEECAECFPSKAQLSSHESRIHGRSEEGNPCPHCAKQVNDLKAHIYAIHEAELMICSKCDYRTRNKQSLKQHFKNIHTEVEMKTCQFCGGSFKRIDRHLQINNCGQEERKRSKCEHCEKTFVRKETMKKHIKIVHLQVRNKICMYCDYKTYTKFNLDIHISKMHLGTQIEKQSCGLCTKKTYKMDYHMKVYHPEV